MFILYEIVFVTVLSGRRLSWPSEVAYYILAIALFYTHAHYTLPLSLRAPSTLRKVTYLIFGIACELLLYVGLMFLARLFTQSISISQVDRRFLAMALPHTCWRGIYFLLFGTAYYLAKNAFEQQQRAAMLDLKLEKSKSELLRAQINPHVLFNTLNFIHNGLEERPKEATAAIEHLSDLMDYALTPADQQGMISLQHEVEHIHTMLALHKLRFGQGYISLAISPIEQHWKIPPLLLITFIENMLKHGELSNLGNPAIIELSISDGRLRFYCENAIPMMDGAASKGHGIGLNNIQQRLASFYANESYSLQFGAGNGKFTVRLTIKMNG